MKNYRLRAIVRKGSIIKLGAVPFKAFEDFELFGNQYPEPIDGEITIFPQNIQQTNRKEVKSA